MLAVFLFHLSFSQQYYYFPHDSGKLSNLFSLQKSNHIHANYNSSTPCHSTERPKNYNKLLSLTRINPYNFELWYLNQQHHWP